MEHTPGPWRLGRGYADYLAIEAYYSDDDAWWPIATIELDEHGAKPTPEQEANARLIEAAPAMYEALEASRSFVQMIADGETETWNMLTQIEKALALGKRREEE